MDFVSFGTIYSWFCCGTCVVSCIFNGLLIWIVQQRRAGIGFYRFFTLATVLVGVSYSFALAGSQPLWYAGHGILGFFSIAPWYKNIKLIRFAYQFWFTSFVLILLCMTCSFLYRYGLLCSPRIVYCFETPRSFVIILCLFLAICIWWLYNANYLLFQESLKLRKMIHNKVSTEYSVDLMSSYMLVVDINDEFEAIRSIFGALIVIVIMQIQIVMMFYCGFKIHTTVGVRTMSHRMKQIHRNALKMMISQALNPMLFLYAPVFINLFGMFVEVDFGQLPKVIAMSFSLFPIFNPLIVIYFTQEYKRFIFPRRSSTVQVSTTKSGDFAIEMSFAVLYKWFCFITCITSFFFNGLLIYIVYKKRAGIGFYRYFTQATVLIGVLYSLAFAIAQPFWYAGPGILGFFSIAPWNERMLLIRISFQFWFTTFVLILLAMSASFNYRYGLLCSPFIVSLFKTPSRLFILAIFLLVFMVLWMYNTNYMLFGDSRAVRWKMQIKLSSEYKVDFLSSYALTVDINDPISAKHSIISTVIITIAFQVLIAIMFYCGWSIHKTVKMRTMSDRLSRIHGRALNMMISQALNPLMFLYMPAVINLFGMFVDRDFGDLPKVLAMFLALFPIFNPMIVIYFTEEYKRFLLRQRSSVVQVSATKSRDHPFIP